MKNGDALNTESGARPRRDYGRFKLRSFSDAGDIKFRAWAFGRDQPPRRGVCITLGILRNTSRLSVGVPNYVLFMTLPVTNSVIRGLFELREPKPLAPTSVYQLIRVEVGIATITRRHMPEERVRPIRPSVCVRARF